MDWLEEMDTQRTKEKKALCILLNNLVYYHGIYHELL